MRDRKMRKVKPVLLDVLPLPRIGARVLHSQSGNIVPGNIERVTLVDALLAESVNVALVEVVVAVVNVVDITTSTHSCVDCHIKI